MQRRDCERVLGAEGAQYKFIWKGCEQGTSGVGVLIAERWIDDVIEVRRVSERIIVIRFRLGKSVVNLISVYAPQVGRPREEKEEFLALLGKVLYGISDTEGLVVCGDLNGHVGAKCDGFEGVHGGNGFGVRNVEGEMLLEFADAMDLVVANTWFQKPEEKKVTYASGGNESVVDYVLVRKRDRKMVRDVKIISGESCLS